MRITSLAVFIACIPTFAISGENNGQPNWEPVLVQEQAPAGDVTTEPAAANVEVENSDAVVATDPLASEPLIIAESEAATSKRFAVGLGVSTLGLELSGSYRIYDWLNVTVNAHKLDFDYEPEPEDSDSSGGNDLDYNGSLNLSSFGAYLDYHPFKGTFRARAGIVKNGNEITATGSCNAATCELGDNTFTAAEIGRVDAKIDFDDIAPYVGVGWGNTVRADKTFPLGITFDLGVMMQGSPNIDISSTGSCSQNPDCQSELERERAELENDASDFDIYPVISLGLSYRLF